MIVKYEPFDRIYLFGGTPLISRLAQRLSEGGYGVSIYTAPRQAAEVKPRPGVTLVVTSDINESLQPYEVGTALGITLGCAWRFGPKLREAFGTRLIDFMSIPYPNYLGGAHVSHAIMRGERYWGCCMQLLTENTVQGECHDGPVIFGRPLSFPMEDEHHKLDREYFEFLVDFVEKAKAGYEFKPGVTECSWKNPVQHFPRLNTERQGWINWRWKRTDLLRFIHAFDAPYPGARTTVHDGNQPRVVTVHEPICFGADYTGHPFHSGLITDLVRTLHGARATVATVGGAIAVTVRDDIGKDPTWLRPGMRLHTDQATLDRAMTYTPVYTALGDVARAARD